MGNRIGISTVFTGYNYGSTLQAYAVKQIIKNVGYEPELFKIKGSVIKGRDIRFRKIINIALRSVFNNEIKKTYKKYTESLNTTMPTESKKRFLEFVNLNLKPVYTTEKDLKIAAYTNAYIAFVCGSDQIWNSSSLYVDPFYYLQYAPKNKRIAFAPSFGRDYIAKYNEKTIKKFISDIQYLSIREESGVGLIKDLVDRDATLLVDPTLVLRDFEWKESLKLETRKNERYILAYFLNEPSEHIKNMIIEYGKKYNLPIIQIPYEFKQNIGVVDANVGPKEFLEYISNAELVCTDSFHGTAFSINFNIPFFSFERNYGTAEKQSTRIYSILDMVKLGDRFAPESLNDEKKIDFDYANKILNIKRQEAYVYLKTSLQSIKEEQN